MIKASTECAAPAVAVVGLNGSPHRNGNTVTLMRWVLEGCAAAGAAVEWLHVVDHDIRYCRGCFVCLRVGACPIQDDVPLIRERLLAADGIIVGSPVYAGQPTAQLKTLIDRLTLLNLYTHTFERQRTVGVATSGVAPTGAIAKDLAILFGQCSGTIGAKTASVKHGYQPLTETHHPRLPEQAHALGHRLVTEIQSPRRWCVPKLSAIWFHILRHFIVRPLVRENPEQFAGVLRIWEEKGWEPVTLFHRRPSGP